MSIETKEVITELQSTLDHAALREFGKIEQTTLIRSMEFCGMTALPKVGLGLSSHRASGEVICEACGQAYALHPMDWRVIGYGDVPFLNILCDGRRVKL